MNGNAIDPTPFFILGAITVVLLVWVIGTFNRFARLRNHVRESWSNLEVVLKRRHDLIPNLVEAVKGYSAYESGLFERVTQLRSEAARASGTTEIQAAEMALAGALQGLMVHLESYPDLKASGQFLSLQRELSDTEDRIAAARRFFNSNVRELNAALDSFPASIIGKISGTPHAEFFALDNPAQAAVPNMGFS